MSRPALRVLRGGRAPQRIGVLGGGIAGLASAWFLLRAGYRPVVLEATAQLGGVGTHFEHAGYTLDRFCHVMVDSDADLCGLVDDLGLRDVLHWSRSGMGFHVDGRLYGFNTPLDLLRFGALGVTDRVRAGLGALYITRTRRNALALDDVPARQWLLRIFGRRAYERIWDPLLRAKFGDRRDGVPAYWVWNALNLEKNGSPKVKGYPRCGYRGLAEALGRGIAAGGGEVRLASPVDALEAQPAGIRLVTGRSTETVDAVISTLPLQLLRGLAQGALRRQVPLPDLAYQGIVSVLVVARRRLGRFYRTVVVDRAFPFQGLVETTHVIPPEWIGGRHLIHVMKHCDAVSEAYGRAEEVLERQAVDGLCRLYPHFQASDIEATYVFRAPDVEPVWTLGRLRRRLAPRVADTRLYVCTAAQAYPRFMTWNTSVALAKETVTALTADLGQTTAEAA